MKNILASLALALVVSACSDSSAAPASAAPAVPATPAAPPAPAAPVAAADPKAEADTIFVQRCGTCHGATGLGDGPAAAALNPKPRAYNDAAWQKTVTDDVLAKVIVEGGPAVGKSPLMAANADLAAKPEVVKALVAKIRSFAPAAGAAPSPN